MQGSTWEPLSHAHQQSYQASKVLLCYDQKMRRLFLPSRLEAPPVARDPQDKDCLKHFCRRPSQSRLDTWGSQYRSSWESGSVTTPGLSHLNALRKPGTKKENGRRENFGRSRWKGTKYSHNKALTTFSHSHSDGFNKGVHITFCQPTRFLQRQLD